MGKLKQFWSTLRSSLWFFPTIIVAVLIALALVLIEVDRETHSRLAEDFPRLFAAGSDGSRAMLSALATAMMTVASVVFSITIVALAQASSQYSPRVLRNFMRDRANQLVLGSFVGIFTYCLIVLRNISRSMEGEFVPAVAVFCGFALALVGVALLIFFIHHIAASIQASNVIHAITRETVSVVQKMFPPRDETDGAESSPGRGKELETALNGSVWHAVPSRSFGYVQRVEKKALFRIACARCATIRMEVAVGEFAVRGSPLVSVCGEAIVDDALIRRVNLSFGIDACRTVDQDPAFGIRQLVDIAVKALSPGINDTTTAVTAVDYLSQILCEIGSRRLDSRHRFDGQHLRVIAREMHFGDLLERAFSELIENTRGNSAMIIALLNTIARVSEATHDAEDHRVLMVHLQNVAGLREEVPAARTRAEITAHAEQIRHRVKLRC